MSTVSKAGHFIGGEWRTPASGRWSVARNPSTGESLGEVADGVVEEVDQAVAAARAAWLEYRLKTPKERAAVCLRIAGAISDRREHLANLIAKEQGKPLYDEAYDEVDLAIEGFTDAAEIVKYLEGSTISLADPNKRAFSIYQPRGVYAVVTPWNFPINIPTEYLAPGLAAGNAIVWVPAPTTSLCAIELMRCMEAAGLPDGLVNLITGPGPIVGDAAVAHPDTDAVAFTGSSATGKRIAERAAGKPTLLELGGNGPTIVFADADLEQAAESIAGASFFCAGQTCAATELVLAHVDIAADLAQLLGKVAEAVEVGDPLSRTTQMGPLNNAPVAEKMESHVRDAESRGATIITGGHAMPELGSPLFYAPTVLTDVPKDAMVVSEETFGPIAPVVTFSTESDALAIAAQSGLGLSASVWTKSMGTAQRTAEALPNGIVNINESSAYWEIHVPFGGSSRTSSGIGRLGGRHTLVAMSDIKTITYDITRF